MVIGMGILEDYVDLEAVLDFYSIVNQKAFFFRTFLPMHFVTCRSSKTASAGNPRRPRRLTNYGRKL